MTKSTSHKYFFLAIKLFLQLLLLQLLNIFNNKKSHLKLEPIFLFFQFLFYLTLIVSCHLLKQKQNWLTSALWNYDKTGIKQKQQTAWILTASGAYVRALIRGEKMPSKLLSSQFPPETDSLWSVWTCWMAFSINAETSTLVYLYICALLQFVLLKALYK